MSKRKIPFHKDEEQISMVEKLYRENQESDFLGGGFDEDDDVVNERREEFAEKRQKRADRKYNNVAAPDTCSKCEKILFDSWLWDRFCHPVCDACRDDKVEHKLIARTEAKATYLLKDCDFDLRKPPLRFYSKKNPHNPRYGDMKLYLKLQVVKRAIEVHGSLEDMEEKKKVKEVGKESRSEKRFEKKIKDLRQQMRDNSGQLAKVAEKHVHEFGEEVQIDEDNWRRTCNICEYEENFEKM